MAGDHHIHSRYSVRWNRLAVPPVPIIGGNARYAIPMNAFMSKHYGLDWIVATDHGGRYHSKVNLERAYPELLLSRDAVPEVIQYFGVELNAPGGDHASVIMPQTDDEADRLYQLESRFDRADADPTDRGSDTEARMLEALRFMREFADKPVVIANHPSRTARGASYGRYTPAELRQWNETAPDVAVGMAGAPGHQAAALAPDGSIEANGARGQYRRTQTLGGFDPMTARLGGFWDSMLGEGRHWWITANSDSHRHWREGGNDFWPGEYSKTYVYAGKTHAEILAALRAGRVFVTTGDLISELYLTVATDDGTRADIGDTLKVEAGASVLVSIRVRDPETRNAHDEFPSVSRVDLIGGDFTGVLTDPNLDTNPTTRVLQRFGADDWSREDEWLTMVYRLEGVDKSMYLRVRGTNTDELEPAPDPRGENPWNDLWFYSNPIFLQAQRRE